MSIDIAKLRELLERKTPGRWHVNGHLEVSNGHRVVALQTHHHKNEVDPNLIAAAVNALPALLAIVEAAMVAVDTNRRCDTGANRHEDNALEYASDTAFVALCAAVDAARKP